MRNVSVPAVLCILFCAVIHAKEPIVPGFSAEIEVATASGRIYSGTIDRSSTQEELVLNTVRAGMLVQRAIQISSIDSVTSNRQPIAVGTVVEGLSSLGPEESRKARSSVLHGGSYEAPIVVRKPRLDEVDQTVAYLDAWAVAKNWDADVEIDGLEVEFAAMCSDGSVSTAKGYLEAELYGFETDRFDAVPQGHGARYRRLGAWRVSPQQTISKGDLLVARLAYQTPSPVQSGRIVPFGILVLRWVVPGQGTFSKSLEDLRLVPYSAIRDSNQLRGNPRYWREDHRRYRP